MINKTFKQQFDKITEAYIKGEIKPFDPSFCFCGTLAPDKHWGVADYSHHDVNYDYTRREYRRMEAQLLSPICLKVVESFPHSCPSMVEVENHQDYEDVLFLGMCNALDELRKIHEEHGEVIEDQFVLPKREKVLV